MVMVSVSVSPGFSAIATLIMPTSSRQSSAQINFFMLG